MIIILMTAKSKTISNESSQVLTDPQDKPKHKIEAFQDYCILSLNGGEPLTHCGLSFHVIMFLNKQNNPIETLTSDNDSQNILQWIITRSTGQTKT